jgi:hypothetical protein
VKKIMVGKKQWLALAKVYEIMVAADPGIEERWLDQCRTSHASCVAGGIAELETDYDWLIRSSPGTMAA